MNSRLACHDQAGAAGQGDGLPGERLDEDLHSSSQATHEVKSGLLLDVVE
jgi:hypothetical protein